MPGLLLANVRRHFAEFLQRGSLKRHRYTLPVHQCRFRVRSYGGLFPGTAEKHDQSDKVVQSLRSVTSSWLRNINLIPIDYAFRPRLRGRLTLLRLTLRQEPLDFRRQGLSPCLTLLMSSFSLLITPPGLTARLHSDNSPPGLHREAGRSRHSQNAPLPPHLRPEASARGLSPVTSSPQDNLSRPVSCYAFFKGWLLLSQPPGCFGRPTCFPT